MLAPAAAPARIEPLHTLHALAPESALAPQFYYGLLLLGRIAFRTLERVDTELRATGLLLAPSHAIKLRTTERSLLAEMYAGKRPKEIALDTGRSQAMVATATKLALAKQGLTTREGAVWVAHSLSLGLVEASTQFDPEHGSSTTTLQVRAELASPVFQRLSLAERAVVCRIIDGASQQTIARERNTSVRTVANQLATVFRKAGTSDRLELVRRLIVAPRAMVEAAQVAE